MQFLSSILSPASSCQSASILPLTAQFRPRPNHSFTILERRSIPIIATHSILSDGGISLIVTFLLSDASHLDPSIKSFKTFARLQAQLRPRWNQSHSRTLIHLNHSTPSRSMAPRSVLSDGCIASIVRFLLSDASHRDSSIKSFKTFASLILDESNGSFLASHDSHHDP